jgi:hypothetical protein
LKCTSVHAFGYAGYVYILAEKRVKGERFKPYAICGYLVRIVG